ncbi:hypothetical protein BLNAU_10591 [Blattamonas nauphoetae]|uniref:FPL domain-containing protein n=1 Tax=Blattamonas nauphoetae TaxID=2049346 RepID=A0ABQ9XS34_9EUKA|nr:hypothetical protein BLNAU_10591 [Blattamonas nauphoetae]
MESLFFEPEIVDSLFFRHEDFILSTFTQIGKSSPPPAIITTLARISLFPHLGIAYCSLKALYIVIYRYPSALTLLPSLIIPLSSPNQQYSGLSFLSALTKKLRIVFFEFQQNLPTNPSRIPNFIQITKDDPFYIKYSLYFCIDAFFLPLHLLKTTPSIEVDSETIQELILYVKETLTAILTNISTIDNLIASLPSDSFPTTPSVSGVEIQMIDSLQQLRHECEIFVINGWGFIAQVTFQITDPHKTAFQTIILDDPSFPDFILDSLKLNHKDIRKNTLIAITNIVFHFRWMKQQLMTANLVGRMLEAIDFVSLPLSESKTLFVLTKLISFMFNPIGDNANARFEQYPLIRVSVFEPAKHFITFIFHNSNTLILKDEDKTQHETQLCWIHTFIKNMELRSDEIDADFVSELVKWEMRTMVEMENEESFKIVFGSMQNRTSEWNRDKREQQKRREVVLREEGWDDVFELRVVGIDVDTNQHVKDSARRFRKEVALNADEL